MPEYPTDFIILIDLLKIIFEALENISMISKLIEYIIIVGI